MNKLNQISRESVPVFLEKSSGVVEDDTGEMVEAEGDVGVGFRLQIIAILAVNAVQLLQERLIRAFVMDRFERLRCAKITFA